MEYHRAQLSCHLRVWGAVWALGPLTLASLGSWFKAGREIPRSRPRIAEAAGIFSGTFLAQGKRACERTRRHLRGTHFDFPRRRLSRTIRLLKPHPRVHISRGTHTKAEHMYAQDKRKKRHQGQRARRALAQDARLYKCTHVHSTHERIMNHEGQTSAE